MRNIKTFEKFNFWPKSKQEPDYKFTENEILDIKDMFLDITDEYPIEEDKDGRILDYINISAINKKGRSKAQYFIERKSEDRLLVFSIASSSGLLFNNTEFLASLEEFKERLSRVGYKCGANDTLYKPWIKYISFYIDKFID